MFSQHSPLYDGLFSYTSYLILGKQLTRLPLPLIHLFNEMMLVAT